MKSMNAGRVVSPRGMRMRTESLRKAEILSDSCWLSVLSISLETKSDSRAPVF